MAKEKKDKKALKNAKKDIWNNYSASENKRNKLISKKEEKVPTIT